MCTSVQKMFDLSPSRRSFLSTHAGEVENMHKISAKCIMCDSQKMYKIQNNIYEMYNVRHSSAQKKKNV